MCGSDFTDVSLAFEDRDDNSVATVDWVQHSGSDIVITPSRELFDNYKGADINLIILATPLNSIYGLLND